MKKLEVFNMLGSICFAAIISTSLGQSFTQPQAGAEPDPIAAAVSAVKSADPIGAAVKSVKSAPKTCSEAADCNICMAVKNCGWCIPKQTDTTNFQKASCIETEASGGAASARCSGTLLNPSSVNATVTQRSTDNNQNTFILSPENIKAKLRVGDTLDIQFNLNVDLNKQLDVYYLTDMSKTMEDDLRRLKSLSTALQEEIAKLSQQAKLGFGTFIDKKMAPFSDLHNTVDYPLPTDLCHRSFGFCNALALTDIGGTEFEEAVKGVKVSANIDSPEGGLEALIQVMVCEEQIKWNKGAFRIIIYTSDSVFKYAGAGKLAGIEVPNDGKCHMKEVSETDHRTYYTHSDLQDYPSVYQVSKAAEENNIHIIFAVTSDVLPLYKRLSNFITDSRAIKLQSDSSNVINVIKEAYYAVSESLEVKATSTRDTNVTLDYQCGDATTESCDNLQAGTDQDYGITAHVTLKECPRDGANMKETIKLSGANMNDVSIDVEYICSCDCMENSITNSPDCSEKGNSTCGQCSCIDPYFGEDCSCDQTTSKNTTTNNTCVKPGGSGDECEGHGECICINCECEKGYYGDYCECQDKDCPRSDAKNCAGHGICECSKCLCDEGWSGDDCSCSTKKTGCIKEDDTSGEECSSHGSCKCNSCKCDLVGGSQNERYEGPLCDKCPTCGEDCDAIAKCVLCYLLGAGDNKVKTVGTVECDSLMSQCPTNISISQASKEAKLNQCSLKEGDCTRDYYYYRDSISSYAVYISKDWVCPIQLWVILVSVIVPIVVIGLIIVFAVAGIRRLQEIKDVKKMNADVVDTMADFNMTHLNDLYKNPIGEVSNPMFQRPM